MTTVSARPDNLAAYRSRLEVVDRDLRSTAGSLLQTLEAYRTRCPAFGADHTELAYTLGEYATAMEELDGWVGRVGEAFRHADRAPGPVPVGVVLTTEESVKVAEPEFEKLEPEGGMDAKAIAGLIADITGIFDPTPISDGVSGAIDLSDGDFAGASLSLASMVPFLGDALAKPAKFLRKILKYFPALKRLGDGGAILDLLKHLDWKNPVRLNRALGTLASLQSKAELAYKNLDWLSKAKKLGLPTEGGVPFVPPKNWDVNFPRMAKVNGRDGYVDAFGNVWVKNGEDWYIQPRGGFESLTKDGSPSLSVGKDGKLQDPQALREQGSWKLKNESMSPRAAAYQEQVTGAPPGQVYDVRDVNFDGFKDGVLQEAKGPGYATHVENGRFKPYFGGARDLVDQARRQLNVAGGAPIRWSVAEEEAAIAMRNLFAREGITGIEVVHVPAR